MSTSPSDIRAAQVAARMIHWADPHHRPLRISIMSIRISLPVSSLGVVLALFFVSASTAQISTSNIEYDLIDGSGIVSSLVAGNSVQYRTFDGSAINVPVLVTRPSGAILCARTEQPPDTVQSDRYVTIDPSGFVPPYQASPRSVDPRLSIQAFPDWAQTRSSEPLDFGQMAYLSAPLLVNVNDIDAQCVEGLSSPTVSFIGSCPTLPTSYAPSDRIQRFDFERAGTLEFGVRAVATTPMGIAYQYQVRAVGGQVHGVQLREQFPYATGESGVLPLFQGSLALVSSWSCHASPGAWCRPGSSSDGGNGYAYLNGAILEAGACLELNAIRGIYHNGQIQDSYSGSIHGAVFYSGHEANGKNSSNVELSRLNFDW